MATNVKVANPRDVRALVECEQLVAERDYLSRSQDPRGPQRDIELLTRGVDALALLRHAEAQHLLEAVQAVVLREPVLACELVLARISIRPEIQFQPPQLWQCSQSVYAQLDPHAASSNGTWISDVSCWVAEPKKLSTVADAQAAEPRDPGLTDDGRLCRRCEFAREPSAADLRRAGALALLRALSREPTAARSTVQSTVGPAAGLTHPLSAVAADTEARLARAAVYRAHGFRREEQVVMDSLRLELAARSHPLARKAPDVAIAQAEARQLHAHATSRQRQQRKQRLAALILAAKGPVGAGAPSEAPPPAATPMLSGWLLAAVTSTLVCPAVGLQPAAVHPRSARARSPHKAGAPRREHATQHATWAAASTQRRPTSASAQRPVVFSWDEARKYHADADKVEWDVQLSPPFQGRAGALLQPQLHQAQSQIRRWQEQRNADRAVPDEMLVTDDGHCLDA